MPDEQVPAVVAAEIDARDEAEMALRDAGGMFLPGVSGNPAGRPKGTKNHLVELQRQLEIAVRENVNPKAVRALIGRIMAQAMAGDMKAAKLILDKLLANATSGGDEATDSTPKIVFEIKNLTLKQAEPAPVVIDVTPQEIKQ